MNTYTFGIARPWEPGTTAIITVTTDLTYSEVKQAVIAAATTWSHSKSGADATEEHRTKGWDFNIGDLSSYLDDPALQQTLRDNGIATLTIDTVDGPEYLEWDFDDPVVDFEGPA